MLGGLTPVGHLLAENPLDHLDVVVSILEFLDWRDLQIGALGLCRKLRHIVLRSEFYLYSNLLRYARVDLRCSASSVEESLLVGNATLATFLRLQQRPDVEVQSDGSPMLDHLAMRRRLLEESATSEPVASSDPQLVKQRALQSHVVHAMKRLYVRSQRFSARRATCYATGNSCYCLSRAQHRVPQADMMSFPSGVHLLPKYRKDETSVSLSQSHCNSYLIDDHQYAFVRTMNSGQLIMVDLGNDQICKRFKGHTATVTSVCPLFRDPFAKRSLLLADHSAGLRRLISSSSDGASSVPDVIRMFKRGHVQASSMFNSRVLTSSADATLRVWNFGERSGDEHCLATLRGHTGSVNSVKANYARDAAVSVGHFGDLFLWDLHTGRSVFHNTVHQSMSACVCPDLPFST